MKVIPHLFLTKILKKLSIIIFILLPFFGFAQEVNIVFEKTRIARNEALNLSVESVGKKIEQNLQFPEIEGFTKIKGRISSATSTSNIDGNIIVTYIRTQEYHPNAVGVFDVPPFTIKINKKDIQFQGITLTVAPPDESKGELLALNYQDFFISEEDKKFIEVQEDAFLGLSVDRELVYRGEGFNVILAFYVNINNQAPMKFPDMGRQVEEISQKLKPINCWEENFEINRVQEPVRVEINGQFYDQYVFYQASFYPLNTQTIRLPKVGLKILVKNRISTEEENPNRFDEESSTNPKTFWTNPKEIRVKELPPHPYKDKVAVGGYYRIDSKPQQVLKTGESFQYKFQITGEGNIAAIQTPEVIPSGELDFYPPHSNQIIKRGENKVVGAKIFSYQVIPKESGEHSLRDYLYWVYFNPKTARYDTLRPQINITVSGESLRNAEISSSNISPFYQNMEEENTVFINLEKMADWKLMIEILLFILLMAAIALIYYH